MSLHEVDQGIGQFDSSVEAAARRDMQEIFDPEGRMTTALNSQIDILLRSIRTPNDLAAHINAIAGIGRLSRVYGNEHAVEKDPRRSLITLMAS